MGVKTQKVNKALVEQPIGKVIAAALASFAKRGQPIVDVQQREDGCTFTVRSCCSWLTALAQPWSVLKNI